MRADASYESLQRVIGFCVRNNSQDATIDSLNDTLKVLIVLYNICQCGTVSARLQLWKFKAPPIATDEVQNDKSETVVNRL